MNKIFLIVVLIVVLVGAFIFSSKNSESVVQNEPINNVPATENTPQIPTGNAVNTDNPVVSQEIKKGMYQKFAGDVAQFENKDIVLFFKADWCPSCRTLDNDIKNSLNDIPENVVILELNYDTETELKKKYGVTTQHTLVQVDTQGNLIKKWSGGSNLENVLSQIN